MGAGENSRLAYALGCARSVSAGPILANRVIFNKGFGSRAQPCSEVTTVGAVREFGGSDQLSFKEEQDVPARETVALFDCGGSQENKKSK